MENEEVFSMSKINVSPDNDGIKNPFNNQLISHINKVWSYWRPSFLIILSFALLLGICAKSKSDGSGEYYFKFTAGSQSFTYTGNSYATLSTSDDIYMAGIGGFKDMSVGTKNVASVLVGSLNPIANGTYSGLVYQGTGGNTPKIFLSWIDANGKTFGSLYQDYATNTVTITQLSSSVVKGTFSGKIYDVSSSGSAPINFSGEFYVKRMN